MAITTYSQLKTRALQWMRRNNIPDADVAEWVSLAEARLNRMLKVVETEAALTGISGDRAVSISALSVVEPMALKLVETNGSEREVIPKPYGVINYLDLTACPSFYEISGTNIKFDTMLDQAYALRFIYMGRFALSDAAPTNKLLTEHPDVYLAATIMWGGLFTEDDPKISKWKSLLDEAMPEVQHTFAQAKRTELTVDPMFTATSRRGLQYWPLYP